MKSPPFHIPEAWKGTPFGRSLRPRIDQSLPRSLCTDAPSPQIKSRRDQGRERLYTGYTPRAYILNASFTIYFGYPYITFVSYFIRFVRVTWNLLLIRFRTGKMPLWELRGLCPQGTHPIAKDRDMLWNNKTLTLSFKLTRIDNTWFWNLPLKSGERDYFNVH